MDRKLGAMEPRGSGVVAWSMAVVAVLLSASAVVLAALNDAGTVVDKVANALITGIPYPVVGALILSRTSGNQIGWVFCAVGLLQGLNVFADEYGHYALVTDRGSLPGGFEMGWVAFWTWMPSLALLVTYLLLLFPSGHPPSPRWRWVGWLSAAGIGMIVLPVAIAAWPVRGTGLEILDEGGVNVEAPILVAVPVGFAFVLVGALASVASLVIRYRRSAGEERLQLKWFMFAGALAFTTILLAFTPIDLGEWSLGIGLIAIPLAVGVAIMKYRLFDIDRLINRTLVYAIVTGSALAVYAATVFVISTIAVGSGDNLTVAAATLAAAAAFRPLLMRVQGFVDQRFFRRKYDSQQTIDAFGYRLREETDLDALTADLVGVVLSTMQPTQAWVWLLSSEEGPRMTPPPRSGTRA